MLSISQALNRLSIFVPKKNKGLKEEKQTFLFRTPQERRPSCKLAKWNQKLKIAGVILPLINSKLRAFERAIQAYQ